MATETLKNEWLKDFSLAEFEGRQYPIIKNYDEYLTHLYGDYMTPPPEDQRKADHLEVVKRMKKLQFIHMINSTELVLLLLLLGYLENYLI